MQDFVSNFSFTDFKLNGFHTLGEWRPMLFIPYFLMFLLSIIGNSTILYVIISHRALHSPMFVLIGLMALVDLCSPFIFVPHLLLIFLFDFSAISLVGCLIQMFCIHYSGTCQSTLLLCMALDRYFAICRPLFYQKHMEFSNFLKIIIVPLIRNGVLISTVVCLAGRLSYCSTNVIDHCFCEHMALVQLACGDISINNLVGLLTAFLVPTVDFVLIALSYIIIFISVLKSGKAHLKAMNTCITHIIVITFTLIFALFSFMLYRINNNISPGSRVFLSTMYLLFPSCCNPIIYGLRTKEIRLHFLKLIKHMKVLPL
ncbi:olfactory receptor 52K1-like [Electrophorus electricus]|uniref:G-protein coupled receptors family 1 profile domain-containing protein n=1 Tax=Electrophorus electricus TaxID=8005 RepID=A0A4W4HME9_ELEEL|nr:olfactory receptor 52K1-like [Electrophorus electricus]